MVMDANLGGRRMQERERNRVVKRAKSHSSYQILVCVLLNNTDHAQ